MDPYRVRQDRIQILTFSYCFGLVWMCLDGQIRASDAQYRCEIIGFSAIPGRFHVKGPRKKVNVEKWIFFYEMWKIIGQIDDIDRFLKNSCDLGVFLAKNQKYPKMTVLKKWKFKKRRKEIKDWKTYFKYHI